MGQPCTSPPAVAVDVSWPETPACHATLGALLQWSNFGMGGWWLGGSHMKPNVAFMSDVQVGGWVGGLEGSHSGRLTKRARVLE